MLGLWCQVCDEHIDSSDGSCPECLGPALTDAHPSPTKAMPRPKPSHKPHPAPSRMIRKCSVCGEVKEHRPRPDQKHVPQSRCMDCMKAYLREWRRVNWQRPKARGIWKGMVNRCCVPGHGANCPPGVPRYADYGGKGVKVAKRWQGKDGFKRFLNDVGLPPTKDSTLDRINFRRNYTPSNCRWVDPQTQQENKRTTRWLTAPDPETGEPLTLCLTEWARRIGFSQEGISRRISRGWTVEHAVSWAPLKPGERYLRILASLEEVPF